MQAAVQYEPVVKGDSSAVGVAASRSCRMSLKLLWAAA